MLKRFFIRDRMLMTGLIVLGLFTVAAGFVSGRSTFQYALATDARQASTAWVERAEREIYTLRRTGRSEIAGREVKIIAPAIGGRPVSESTETFGDISLRKIAFAWR